MNGVTSAGGCGLGHPYTSFVPLQKSGNDQSDKSMSNHVHSNNVQS